MREIRHRQERPFPESEYSELVIPDDSYLGTGNFEIALNQVALGLDAFAAFEVYDPHFELAIEAQPRIGVLTIRLGHRKYGDYELTSRHIYALAKVDDAASHLLRVVFEKWRLLSVTLDGVPVKQTDKTPPVGEWLSSTDRSAELAPPITDGLLSQTAPLPEHEGTLYFAFPHSDLPIEFQRQLLSAVRTAPGNVVLLAKRQGNTVFEIFRDSANALVYHHWNPSFGERRIGIPVGDALREDLRGLILTVTWSPDKSVFYATAVYNDGTSDKRQGVAFSRDKLLLVEGTLVEFERILATEGREEESHQFLKANPILLGLTSSIEPISKLKLGDDYVTDFVIREQGDGYVFVEIERPSLPLFKKGDPPERTAELNHAIEQIESWRGWVGRHHAYLATKLEGVSPDPLCWVVAGRRTALAPGQVQRLEEINRTYRSVFRIFTYDAVADRVRSTIARVRATGHRDTGIETA